MRATNETPTVSILTAAYQQQDMIGKAIESVLAQTYSAWEMLIVDDGSTDRTVEVARSYRDPRIICLEQPHVGIWKLATSYGRALGRARGRLLAILDADDWWPEDKLEREVPLFDDPAVILAYGSVGVVYEGDGHVVVGHPPAHAVGVMSGARFAQLMLREKFCPHSVTVMLRRDALDGSGGFVQPDSLAVDGATWLTIAPGGKVAGIDALLGYYRVHSKSVMRTFSAQLEVGLYRFYADYLASTPAVALAMSADEAAELRKSLLADAEHLRGARAAERGDYRDAVDAFRAAIRIGGLRRVKSIGRLAQTLIRRRR